MKIEIEISEDNAVKLATLCAQGTLRERVSFVLLELVEHTQQGVQREGAWEREWVEQAFGTDFAKRLEHASNDELGELVREAWLERVSE